jgi:hypothetical protein
MNRMGWAIALAGAWALASLAVIGATTQGGSNVSDCAPGYYLSGGWCVHEPQPTDVPGGSLTGGPGASSVLVVAASGSGRPAPR